MTILVQFLSKSRSFCPNILHELPDNAVESSSGEGEKCEILGLTNMKSVREKSIFFDLVLFSANGG